MPHWISFCMHFFYTFIGKIIAYTEFLIFKGISLLKVSLESMKQSCGASSKAFNHPTRL